MGCDIHFYVECKKDNRWISVDEWVFERVWNVPRKSRFYDDRNYTLFAVLADVRNYDDQIIPILERNRGIPKDLSEVNQPNIRDIMFNEECHNHSWLTLKEIIDYPWDMELTFENVYIKKGDLLKEDWALESDFKYGRLNINDYEIATVKKSLWDLCSDFTNLTIPKLKALGSPEEVRAVFAFDN